MPELPNCIWRRIFSFFGVIDLIRLELVSRGFRSICLDSWRNVTRVSFGSLCDELVDVRDGDRILAHLLSRATCLRSLDLSATPEHSWQPDLSPESLRMIGQMCPKLKELDLSYLMLTDLHLGAVAESCVSLEELRMRRSLDDADFPDRSVALFLTKLPYLEYLDLGFNEEITGQCLLQLPHRNTLTSLCLDGCNAISVDVMLAIAKKTPHLVALSLHRCSFFLDTLKKKERLISAFTLWKGLQRLNISATCGMEPLFAKRDCQGLFSELRLLDLSHSSAMTDSVMRFVAKNCQKLERFDMAGNADTTNSAVCLLLKQCKRMYNLDLSWQEHLSDDSVKYLTVASSNRRSLKSLLVHNCEFSVNCIVAIIESNPELDDLDVSGCRQIAHELPKFIGKCRQLQRTRMLKTTFGQLPMNGVHEPLPPWLSIVGGERESGVR